ncbi:signal peptidase II [Brotaphodocola sp.]|uniref:signal peptidase II n=1 Tax=Brotaphodocola sp. TaxID=3073577 RepID=UPI003D7EA0C5
MKDKFGNLAVWGIGSILLLWFDQYTKLAATISLKGKSPYVIMDGVFELLYSENRGAAFGILQGRQGFFFVIALLVLAAAGFMMYRMPSWKNARYHALKICLIFITAGAIGNMADRISLGYVVDFLYFSLIDFPIFNVADIYVTTATAALLILFGFYYKDSDLEVFSLKKKSGRNEKGEKH